MVNLIVGRNAIGKTVALRKLMRNNMFSTEYVTNIDWLINPLRDSIINDVRKKEAFEYALGCEYEEHHTIFTERKISTGDVVIASECEIMLDVLSKQVDNAYLDEPEFGLNRNEVGILINYIARIKSLYKDLYIVTHNENFLGVSDKVYTVNNAGILIPVDEGKEYEAFN